MRRLLALALVVPLVAGAGHGAMVSEVQPGDAAIGQRVKPLPAAFGFVDADVDGGVDPDEPVYLDADGSRSATYGDVRLTAYLGHGPGTVVDAAPPELQLALYPARGWIARGAGALWLDTDGDRTVSRGDVRLDHGSVVGVGDADIGAPLTVIQGTIAEQNRVVWIDPDGDGEVDPGEAVYFDVEIEPGTPREVAAGDLRLATHAGDGPSVGGSGGSAGSGGAGAPAGDATADRDRGGGTPGWVAVLVVINLLGLIAVAALVMSRR